MRYRRTFQFFDTEEQAQRFIKSRGRRKANYTPWTSEDGKEHAFVVWYFI